MLQSIRKKKIGKLRKKNHFTTVQVHDTSNLENYLLVLSEDKWSAIMRKAINSSHKEKMDT